MNELLAIILIVLLCCAMFFAWLFALATCPDRMVNLISGTKQNSSPISRASEDMTCCTIDRADEPNDDHADQANNSRRTLLGRSRSIPANRSNGFLAQLSGEKRANSKKLSVVPEADEQLTVTSISQCLRPLIRSPKDLPVSATSQSGGQKKQIVEKDVEAGHRHKEDVEKGLVVRTVLLNRHSEDNERGIAEKQDGEECGGVADGRNDDDKMKKQKDVAAAKINPLANAFDGREQQQQVSALNRPTEPPTEDKQG